MQIKASIILLGGALMITQIGNRKATQDIDVVIATNDRHTYQAVQQAITLVAVVFQTSAIVSDTSIKSSQKHASFIV